MITWIEDRVDTLKRHWEAGLSTTESAKELGSVTRNAVAGKRYRLGLRDQMRSAHPPKSRVAMRARSIQKAITRQAQRPRASGISVSYRKRFPILPEMSKAALREMLRCAVENTL
jgi:GcrA cell cycle regulator